MCPVFPAVVASFGEIMRNPCSLLIKSVDLAERKNKIVLQLFLQILLFLLITSSFFFHASICTLGNRFGSFIDRQSQATLPQL